MTKAQASRDPDAVRMLSIRARSEWIEWVTRLARYGRLDVTKLIEIALLEYAEERRFGEPSPIRIPRSRPVVVVRRSEPLAHDGD